MFAKLEVTFVRAGPSDIEHNTDLFARLDCDELVSLPFNKKGTSSLARLRNIASVGMVSSLPTSEA